MNGMFPCYATAAFGLEGLVSRELKELGMADVAAENGGVRFTADVAGMFACNLHLDVCDRVFIIVGEQTCVSFEELYQLVLSLPWEKYAHGAEAFNIDARCARSRLMSPRDCQSITKKAILDRMRKVRGLSRFPESGCDFSVLVSIHADKVRVLLNTSGDALSRRGYRTWNGEAPLRETLAAALIHLSPWRVGRPLYDPCCGTGTIVAEAALMAAGRCPGLRRRFAMEEYAFCAGFDFSTVRREAESRFDREKPFSIGGSDVDPEAIELARRHCRQAEMEGRVQLSVGRLQDLTMEDQGGVFICNPPYGERLSDQKSCRELYRDLHALQMRNPSWSLCAISSDPGFERAFGKRADRKRRLYNGRLECTYYIFNAPEKKNP